MSMPAIAVENGVPHVITRRGSFYVLLLMASLHWPLQRGDVDSMSDVDGDKTAPALRLGLRLYPTGYTAGPFGHDTFYDFGALSLSPLNIYSGDEIEAAAARGLCGLPAAL
jgi:hypothetical protein